MADNTVSLPEWKGLFDWSMTLQDGAHKAEYKSYDPEKMQWLEEVMKNCTLDIGRRMVEISKGLIRPEESSEAISEKEELLEELTEICESIDFARDLGKVGGLPCVIAFLSSNHSSLRWRAAELLAVCAQNNPPVQKEFLDAGVLQSLLPLLGDPCSTVKAKSLLALSAMVRSFAAGTIVARREGVPALLCSHLSMADGDARVLRKCLQLLHHFCSLRNEDTVAVLESGAVRLLPELYKHEDRDVVHWALQITLLVASHDASRQRLLQEAPNILESLERFEQELGELSTENADALSQELDMARRLQKVFSST
mmetsp:Transcript_19462/g.46454  ORF Transcript_19462/g.46454 Transcript_19462/m.46454 type:complete len:312 (+) Transcript_19462:134-1069(+)